MKTVDKSYMAIAHAIINNNEWDVRSLLNQEDIDINACGNKMPLLMLAINGQGNKEHCPNVRIINMLINANIDINAGYLFR